MRKLKTKKVIDLEVGDFIFVWRGSCLQVLVNSLLINDKTFHSDVRVAYVIRPWDTQDKLLTTIGIVDCYNDSFDKAYCVV